MGRFLITRLQADDWRRYKDIRLAALADAPYAFGRTLASALAMDEQGWRERAGGPGTVVATVAGHDVATASLWVHPERFEVAGLTGMWVDPAARGSGVAQEVVEAVVERARELGIRTLDLHVSEGNARAEALYASLGWVRTGDPELLDPSDPARGLVHRMTRSLA